MKTIRCNLEFNTKGNPDFVDITPEVASCLDTQDLTQGVVTVFVVGSTAGITTLEYESGLVRDAAELYEKIIPRSRPYHHDATWADANGFSHLRAMLTGPSVSIPFAGKKMLLGTWQQIILLEFDNRPRTRTVIVSLIGE